MVIAASIKHVDLYYLFGMSTLPVPTLPEQIDVTAQNCVNEMTANRKVDRHRHRFKFTMTCTCLGASVILRQLTTSNIK